MVHPGISNISKKGPGIFYGWAVLAVAFITMLLGYAVRNNFSVFYPTIVDEFGWGRGSTALMFSITVLVYGLTAPVAGGLVERFQSRLVLPVGAGIAGVGVALCSLATTQWQFYLLYGVMGAIGLSIIGYTPFSAIMSRWFVRKRGLVFGIMNAGFGASLVSAPVAQFLISRFGWQTAYVIIGLFSMAIIVPLCAIFIRRSPQEKGLLPDGIPETSSKQVLGEPQKTANLDGKWAGSTLSLSQALKTRHFWLLFVTSFCLLGLAEQIAVAHQVYFLKDAGYEPMLAATVYSVFGIMLVVGGLCGYFSDRLGREMVFIPSCLLSAGAASLLFLIKDASQPWMPFLFAACFGLGIGTAVPVLFVTVADLFQGKYFGSIQGFVVLGFSLGGAIAPWLAGFLHDKTGSYFVSFLIVLGSLVTSAVLMWLIAPGKARPVPGRAQRQIS